jgi:hypothetical protein
MSRRYKFDVHARTVWEHLPAGGAELAVMLVIAEFCDMGHGVAFPALGEVAALVRRQPDATRRTLHRLVALGFLLVEAELPGRPRTYRIDLPKLWALPCVHAGHPRTGGACLYAVAARHGWELPPGMGTDPSRHAGARP